MNAIDVMQTSSIVAIIVAGIGVGRFIAKRQEKIERNWEALHKHREELYASFADPAKIEADFEKSARAREMRDAQRTTLPREGAGPPAKIWRPKLRGAKPGNWRINRP